MLLLRCFVFLIFLACCLGAAHAHAAEFLFDEKGRMTLDGKVYTKRDFAAAFLETAFTETPWNSDTGEDAAEFLKFQLGHYKLRPSSSNPNSFERTFPWFAPYTKRPAGVPPFGVLNRWEKPVKVSLDLPIYTLAAHNVHTAQDEAGEYPRNVDSDYKKRDDPIFKKLADMVTDVLPAIRAASGQDVQFQAPFADKEQSADYARIRIVPVGSLSSRNYFKFRRYHPVHFGYAVWESFGMTEVEYSNTSGGVSFTPHIRTQVDGYLMPEVDAQLGLVVCRVAPKLGDVLMKVLVTECLIRAMGLPDITSAPGGSLLASWNEEYTPYSMLVGLDGRKKTLFYDHEKYLAVQKRRPDRDVVSKEEWEVWKQELVASLPGGSASGGPYPVPDVKKDMSPYQGISTFDLLMLKLLYCKSLHAGMDRAKVAEVLMTEDTCWQ